jgi:hypothetical protein
MGKKKIGIVMIATNAYFVLGIRFIKKFNYYYTGDYDVTFYFYSDEDPTDYIPNDIDVKFIKTKHNSWVDGTNSKFKNIVDIKHILLDEVDYIYYFDADTNIINPFTEEWFIGDLVGGEHFGNRTFVSNGKGFDRNPMGKSYVPEDSPLPYTYYYGAFFGGNTQNVIEFCETLTRYQIEDQLKGYEPPTNDESYINMHFHYNPPKTVSIEDFKFSISDKGGLDNTRNVNLDISQLKAQMRENRFKIFELRDNNFVLM